MAAPRAAPQLARMARSHDLGLCGERFAERLLRRDGWVILARNYRLGHKEIDLVARRGRLVAFVEVKTRVGQGFGHPLESITRAKRRDIERVARAWVSAHGRAGDLYRFDAIAILWEPGGSPRVDHVADAWRIDDR